MAQPKKKLKTRRVLILRQRARYLGTVKAPDEVSAKAAVAQFLLDEEQQRRLVVREQE